MESEIAVTKRTSSPEATVPLSHLKDELDLLASRAHELQEMEQALDEFLTRYYARILPLSHRLEALRSGVAIRPVTPEPNRTPHPLEDRLKTLYRQLMKTYHPDRARAGAAYDAGTVIRAYEEKDIARLWLLQAQHEWRIRPNAALLADYLYGQQQEIRKASNALAERKAMLKDSEAWLLKERISEAARRGVDLISIIAEQFESRIAALQQDAGVLYEGADIA